MSLAGRCTYHVPAGRRVLYCSVNAVAIGMTDHI
jgi:hypothetical protein